MVTLASVLSAAKCEVLTSRNLQEARCICGTHSTAGTPAVLGQRGSVKEI